MESLLANSARRTARLVWLTIVVAHGMAAVAWFWLEPGGFPWGHSRFWVNRLLPIVGLGWCLMCLVRLHRNDDARLSVLLPAYPAAWAGAAVAARIIFPVTFFRLWLAPSGLALMMVLSLVLLRRGCVGLHARSLAVVAGTWALVGAGVVLSQRPPSPGTHPLDITIPGADRGSSDAKTPVPGVVHLDPRTAIFTSEASITAQVAGLTLNVQPLLRFLSCSPDGCWVVFNRPDDREGPEPRVRRMGGPHEGKCTLDYVFRGLGQAVLGVAVGTGTGAIHVDAATTIDRPVDSHLNSFCDVEVRGHRRLFLAFSPCPTARIEVLPSDYPVGRPARFAYVDERRRFVVAQASSGEKGPFRALAEGKLDPSQPLAITLYDEEREAGRITFDDWSAQLSTQLSPTAGWGAQENAIEFNLSGSSPSSPASIFFTLAGTSVGRGWDCVGHAAGTYRNRITIESLNPLHAQHPCDRGRDRFEMESGNDRRTRRSGRSSAGGRNERSASGTRTYLQRGRNPMRAPTSVEITPSRRDFLRTSAGATVAGAALESAVATRAHAGEDHTIPIVLVGCGGRGTGAASQALSTKGPTRLVAMADVFEDRLKSSLDQLNDKHSPQLAVPTDRQFLGMDAYRKAIDCLAPGGVVLLATPPAFRPLHVEYAVSRGCHVFMEKSFAVDAPGIRRILKAGEVARQKNLKIAGGLMSRHYKPLEEAVEQIHKGAIGEVITCYAYRMHSPVGFLARKPGENELAHQIRNYSNFTWLNGSFLLDWLIHNLDVCCWIKGSWPVSCQGQGGRQVRALPDQLFDHYLVEYTFADGTKLMAEGRHMDQCWGYFGDVIHGAKGCAVLGEGIVEPRIYKGHQPITKNLIWKYKGAPCNHYQAEHDLLFEAIRQDKPYNEAERSAYAALVGILGRMAAESGKMVTWDEALNSRHELAPGLGKLTMNSPAPVHSDAQGNYPIAMPGSTAAT